MTQSPRRLALGDVIEIKYRAWRTLDAEGELVDRWMRAVVVDTGPEVRPLARLADGQVTEIRDYMAWRLVSRGMLGAIGRLAA